MVAQTHPRIWTYLGLRNLLTRYEVENGTEDPYMSVQLRLETAQKAHQTWMNQRTRVRKPSQSPSSSRSRMDQGESQRVRIRYERTLANTLYANDYDEDNFLAPGITLFNPTDSDNDVYQKLSQLQELCATCGQTPADELNELTLILL